LRRARFPLRRLAALLAGLGALSSAWGARADDEVLGDRCLVAYEDGQRQLKEGDLTAARSSFLVCSSRACPRAMHGDCEAWLDQVWASLPTVVLRAVGPDGEVLTGARAQIDGQPARALDGRALALNPGQHELVLEHEGRRVVRQIFVVEGEKLSRRDVAIGTGPDGAAAAAVPGAAARTDPKGAPGSSLDVPKLASGAIGLAGVAGFAYFGWRARAGEDDLLRCSPDCSQSAIGAVQRDYRLTNVSIGVGLVGVVTLATLLLLDAGDGVDGVTTTVGYVPGVGPVVRGRF
jgi:hypothetical protein